MPLGMEIGLGLGHIVLNGDPPPLPKKGAQPSNFRPMSVVAKRLDGSRCHLVRRYSVGLGSGHIVLQLTWGLSSPKKVAH